MEFGGNTATTEPVTRGGTREPAWYARPPALSSVVVMKADTLPLLFAQPMAGLMGKVSHRGAGFALRTNPARVLAPHTGLLSFVASVC